MKLDVSRRPFAVLLLSILTFSCSSAPIDSDQKAVWMDTCKSYNTALQSYIGKSVWFNPAGQLVDYQEKSSDYPPPFSEVKITDVSVTCTPITEEPGNITDYRYVGKPDNQKTTFSLSKGDKSWHIALANPDLTSINNFDAFFYQETAPPDSTLLPWNPQLKYPKVRWKMVVDLLQGKKYKLGVSRDEMTFIKGHPSHVNTTDVAGGHNEQWVYQGYASSDYFYFDGGKLTAIQQQ
jgi:hypothetical protein